MEIVNFSSVAAQVRITNLEGTPYRYGMVTAKATFVVAEHGRIRLDCERPFPLFNEDQVTEYGLLPSDMTPRPDRSFEVIVLGAAYASAAGQTQQIVELAVGTLRRSILVSGDRHWIPGRSRCLGRVSPALGYERMPLTWERAYGGSCECWLDQASVIDLEHPMNKLGCGFDAQKQAQDLGEAFRSPPGYPRLPLDYVRRLPNIEHPLLAINRWEDEPPPYCWATIPRGVGVHLQLVIDEIARYGQSTNQQEALSAIYNRAHPDWIIGVPKIDTVVTIRGMTRAGTWSFRLPRLRVLADYEVGERKGTRELQPHLLMLLPEQSRFYIVFRHFFGIESVSRGTPRSFRLRLVEGWFDA